MLMRGCRVRINAGPTVPRTGWTAASWSACWQGQVVASTAVSMMLVTAFGRVTSERWPALTVEICAPALVDIACCWAGVMTRSAVPISDQAVVVAHHHRVGELAAQRLDLEAISDGLKFAHRFPPLSVLRCLHD